jgi:ribonuclease P protein component
MLPREQRLTARRDFKRVYSGGKAVVNRLLVLRVLRKEEGQVARFGFSSSSKLGNAVLRNRMTRLLRESVRSLAGNIRETGYDAVIIVRPATRAATFVQIREAVEDLLRKAKILERGPTRE